MSEAFLDGRVILHAGDSREVLKGFADASIDSCVTDPPYALGSVVQRFGNSPRSETTENLANPYGRTGRGFMGQRWDTGETAFDPAFWREVLRVLKPGSHVVAFGGTRSYHRLVCAIEDAGFEIRDQLAWVYGSGFPKSHNQKGDWAGWGTALKPAWEPIVMARKPLAGTVAANVLEHGTGALNIDGCRVGMSAEDAAYIKERIAGFNGTRSIGGNGAYSGGETMDRSAAYDASKGRWPANIVHDGSDEVVAAFPQTSSGTFSGHRNEPKTQSVYGSFELRDEKGHVGDSGSAARFFYSAKADKQDRIGSKHPTVKPVDLMQWLCRLVTPPGGTVLDPFAGSGSTGEAAWREGFLAVLVEREETYRADIARRMRLAFTGPDERQREIVKAKNAGKPLDLGPLFGEVA